MPAKAQAKCPCRSVEQCVFKGCFDETVNSWVLLTLGLRRHSAFLAIHSTSSRAGWYMTNPVSENWTPEQRPSKGSGSVDGDGLLKRILNSNAPPPRRTV